MASSVALRSDESQGNDVDLVREILRAAIDESGWKHDAVACALGIHPAYLSRLLSGEKPIAARHLRALPDDIEAIFARRYAESFGLMVVVPASSEKALVTFVSGLAGLLGAKLPVRASAMAKADLRDCAQVGAA